ncbi:hypothetical protein R5R35_008493 [Gryllus longicercus]
MVSRGR